jgi:hypothetical protein
MSGFIIEIFSSFDESAPTTWLADRDGEQCALSERELATVFPTEHEARTAANQYVRKKFVVHYQVREK